MYAGMLREDLLFEPYDDGSGTKIEGQVLQSNITRRRNALAHVSQRAAFCLFRLTPHDLRFTSYRFPGASEVPGD
jgi:hypothetical protein